MKRDERHQRHGFIMRVTLLLLLSGFAISGLAQTQDSILVGLDEKTRSAFTQLLKSEKFGIGGTGPAGMTTGEEDAFDVVRKNRKARELFQNLVKNATPEGRLYGLLGLRSKNKSAYRSAFELLKPFDPPRRLSSYGVLRLVQTEKGLVAESEDRFVEDGKVVTDLGGVVQYQAWEELISAIDRGQFDKR